MSCIIHSDIIWKSDNSTSDIPVKFSIVCTKNGRDQWISSDIPSVHGYTMLRYSKLYCLVHLWMTVRASNWKACRAVIAGVQISQFNHFNTIWTEPKHVLHIRGEATLVIIIIVFYCSRRNAREENSCTPITALWKMCRNAIVGFGSPH